MTEIMRDISPIRIPEKMHLEMPDGSIVEFSRSMIEILTQIALRNQIGYAEALVTSIHNEEFIDRLIWLGGRLIVEKTNGDMYRLERQSAY